MAWNVKDFLEEQKRLEELKKKNAEKKITREEAVAKIKADAAKPVSMPKSTGGGAVYTPLPVHSKTAQEQAAVKRTAQTQPKSTQKEYYSQPTDIGSRTKELRERLEKNKARIKDYSTQLDTIKSIYRVTGDKKYAEKYEREYKEYQSAIGQYNNDINSFNAYNQAEQKRYGDWRSTVRKPERVQLELDAYTAKIEQLEEQRVNIGKLLLGQGADLPAIAEQRRGRIQEINAQIEELKEKRDKLSEELLYSNQFYYEDIRSAAEDFEKQSQFVKGEDSDYRHTLMNMKDRESKQAKEFAGIYAHITDDERDMYNYLYNTRGKEAADKYLEDMKLEEELSRRAGAEMYEEHEKKSGLAKGINGLRLDVGAGLQDVMYGTYEAITGDVVVDAPEQYAQSMMQENSSGVGKVVHGFMRTVSNMAPSILLSMATSNVAGMLGAGAKIAGTVGKVTGAASMGTSAAGNAYSEKVKAGYSPEEARTYAALVGSSEALLQYALGGISKLGGKVSGKVLAKNIEAIDKGFLRVAAKFGKAGASEALEENLQAFLEPAFASWVFNEKYDAPELEELVYTTIISALSGGMFEAGEIVSGEAKRAAEQAQKNTAESGGAVAQARYYDVDKAPKEFLQSVDNELLSFVDKVEAGEEGTPTSYTMGASSERLNQDIKRLTGIDTTSYKHSIGKNSIRHIFRRHGKNGEHDQSMANNDDIARIGYILDNYDNVELLPDVSAEFRNRNQRPAPMIRVSKQVDGTVYVAEAVPDAKAKKLAVVSAYIEKPPQQTRDVQAPQSNVQNASADDGSANSIPQSAPNVNTGNEVLDRVVGEVIESGTVTKENVSDALVDMGALMGLSTQAGLNLVGIEGYTEQRRAVEQAIVRLAELYGGRRTRTETTTQSGTSRTPSSTEGGSLGDEAIAQGEDAGYNNNVNNMEVNDNEQREQGIRIREGSKRLDSSYPDGQVSAVEEGTGRNQSGDIQAIARARRKKAEAARAVEGRSRVSAKELGISKGTKKKTCYIAPESALTQEEIREREKKGSAGIEIVYVVGEMEVEENGAKEMVRGVLSSDGKKMWVQIDNEEVTSMQIMKHEAFHRLKRTAPRLISKLREDIISKYSEEELDELTQAYIDAYEWGADVSVDYVLEEIFADAYAGIDVFEYLSDYEGATRFSEEVQSGTEQYVQENGTSESSGDAKYSKGIDAESNGIKQQLREAQEMLNEMEVVAAATVPENMKSKRDAANWAIEVLKRRGYHADRQGFGSIRFSEKDIRYGVNYADTPAEKAAFAVLYDVLKKGVEIGSHGNHKMRQKETVTFAAPVKLNGIRGNMAVVVEMRNKNYYAHRILFPDGTVFKFSEMKKDTERESHQGVTENGSLADATSSVSASSVSQKKDDVKNNVVTDGGEQFSRGISKEHSLKDDTEDLKAQIDNFEYLSDYEGATRFSEEVQSGAKQYANESATESSGGESFSRGRRAQRGRSIELETMENNRFERLRNMRDNLPSQWHAFTKNYYYIYSNHSFMDYTILEKIKITERNREYIRKFAEELEDGTFRSSEAFDRWAQNFRRGKGRYSWHSISTGETRATGRNDGVDVRKRGSRPSGNIEKGSGIEEKISATDGERHSRSVSHKVGLKEQNAELKAQIDKLNRENARLKAEMKPTTEKTVRLGDTQRAAKTLYIRYDIDGDSADIVNDLREIGNYIVQSGGNISYEWLKRKALALARKMVENAVVRVDDTWQQYADMRDYFREKELVISAEDAANIADFNDFRRRNFGRMPHLRIAKPGERGNINGDFREMCELWPEFFNEEEITNPADQVIAIADALESIQPTYENPYSYNMAAATEHIANDIIDTMLSEDVRQSAPTFADKQIAKRNRDVARVRAAKQEQLSKQEKKHQKEIEQMREESRERTRQALSKEREKSHEREEKTRKEFREREDKLRSKWSARDMMRSINRHADRLTSALLRPNDKRHIPEEFRGVVATALYALNRESVYETYIDPDTGKQRRVKIGTEEWFVNETSPMKKTLEAHERRKEIAALDARSRLLKKIMSETGGKDNAGEMSFKESVRALKKHYEEMESGSKDKQQVLIAPEILDKLGELEDLSDTPIGAMDKDQLGVVWETIRMIEASIENADKMFAKGRFANISRLASRMRDDNYRKRSVTTTIAELKKEGALELLDAQRYFHMLGEAGDALFRGLRKAQDRYNLIKREISEFTRELVKDIDVRALEREKNTVTLGGQERVMSTAQIMELYLLNKRPAGRRHIYGGGIKIDAIPGIKSKPAQHYESIRVTRNEIKQALSKLSSEQKAVADAMKRFAADNLGAYGNEASMEVFGYKKFNDPNYWSIRAEHWQDLEAKARQNKISNLGHSKSLENASTPLFVGSVFETFSRHAQAQAMYAAYLGIEQDVERVKNYSFWDGEATDEDGNVIYEADGSAKKAVSEDVQGIINRVHGAKGVDYLVKQMQDIQGLAAGERDFFSKMSKGLIGKNKAAAIGANLRVIIQQPTAYLRNLSMMSVKYLAQVGNVKKGWEKALKYAPIAWQKAIGYTTAKDLMFDTGGVLDTIAEWSMSGAAAMDAVQFGALWNACEAETKAKRKDLRVGSDEYYKAVADRFTEIVETNQVVDGELQRPQIMRSKNALNQMASAFMSEPLKQFNMLTGAVYDLAHSEKGESRQKALKQIGRTVSALLISGVVNSMAQSVIDAFRDDEDKEEKFAKRWLDALVGDEDSGFMRSNLGNMLNPAQYIPYAKGIVSIIMGYDVSRMDTDVINKAWRAVADLTTAISGDGKKTVEEALTNAIAESARMFGIPASNLRRDLKAVVMSTAIQTDNYLLQYGLEKSQSNMLHKQNSGAFIDILYKAYENDKDAYEVMYNDMIKSGMDAEKIRSGMENRQKKAEGITKVEELKAQRYLNPELEREFNSKLSTAKESGAYKAANAEQKETLEDMIYQLVTKTGNYKDWVRVIEAGANIGLTEEEWLQYKFGLVVKDEPNDRNKLGTYTTEEKDAALKMIPGLSSKEKSYLKNLSQDVEDDKK